MTRRTTLHLFALGMIAMLAFGSRPRTARADGAWLTTPLVNWNTAGAELPAAPKLDLGPGNPNCAAQGRPVESAEDQAVAKAGWTLLNTFQGGWSVRVIMGQSGVDGMCRPLGFQAFVFVSGQFAGTLAPAPMNSREDGVLSTYNLFGPTRPDQTPTISARYLRYTPADALCCPSAASLVQFTITYLGLAPVLTPISVMTMPTDGG